VDEKKRWIRGKGYCDLRKVHKIPIYRSALEIIICDSTQRAGALSRRIVRLDAQDCSDVPAMTWCSRAGNCVCVAFNKKQICHNHIAHEVFHVVSDILSIVGEKYDDKDHESFAYLSGHITELVYQDMKSWGIAVK
jgi:hypothetical protein